MDKRYQVFVSSTSEDLREERQVIIRALLEHRCIPVGMELFPASDDDSWSLIKRVIDDCDYYIVVIAGCYGSLGDEEKSYTQMEYEYAQTHRKPTLAFLHDNPTNLPVDKLESNPELRQKLVKVRDQVKQHHGCRLWGSPDKLGWEVGRGISNLVEVKPRVGWVRADGVVTAKKIYQDNTQLFRAISDFIDLNSPKRAFLIQYSGWNVLPLLQTLWRQTDAEINLYVVSPESKHVIERQKTRIRTLARDDSVARSG